MIHSHDTEQVTIQLYQLTPKPELLDLDGGLFRDRLLSIRDESQQPAPSNDAIAEAATVGDLMHALATIEDSRTAARNITQVFQWVLAEQASQAQLIWDPVHKGIRLSDTVVLKSGEYRDILTAMVAQLRFDRFDGKLPVFTVMLKNPLFFSQNLSVEELGQFLEDRRKLYLPVLDQKLNFNAVLRTVTGKEVYIYEQRTRRNPNPFRIGDRFIASGRMTQDEYQELERNKTKLRVAYVTPYNDAQKHYCYPARDLHVVASDSLLRLENQNPTIEFPEPLGEAIALYRYAKTAIRSQMDARPELLKHLQSVLEDHFELVPPITAECHYLQTPRFRLKGRQKINEEIKQGKAYYTDDALILGNNALCYPTTESSEDKEKKFLSFFSPKSKVAQLGFEFTRVPYSAKLAVTEPNKTAERIRNERQDCNAALVAWPSWSHLPNNKMLEFELMRRNIAVQHVINENFKKDAPKISALLKGMAEKFPVNEVSHSDHFRSITPFDYALGLDVSRHGNLDIASFPVVIDASGRVSCTFSETPYTSDKEKRSTGEIAQVLNRIVKDHKPEGNPISLLFLRDGVAYEDYDEVASYLPDNVSLTVVSVRKNLLNTCSDEMPTGEFYSLFAEHGEDRFVFGINARQGEESKITRLHLAEVVRNPLGVDTKTLGEVLISLACQNKTTEVEIASLPFPIAYADRMAWTIRDMIQDRELCRYVLNQYPEEVDEAGGATLFIYNEIRRFVTSRANGYSFAI